MSMNRHALEEEALNRFVRAKDGMNDAEEQELREWLKTPEHHEAYTALQKTWNALDMLQSAYISNNAPANSPYLSRRTFLTTVASAVAVFGAYGIYRYYSTTPVFKRTFTSGTRELLEISLPDATRVTLDTDTRIEVSYYTEHRESRLLYGQALFNVQHDTARPFQVLAADTTVTVVGTSFSVRNIDDQVQVAVKEGHVQVASVRLPQVIDLYPGDMLKEEDSGKVFAMKKVNPQHVGAWHEGRVVFENATLSDVIKEFHRYGETRLVASDAVKSLRLTGSFDITGAGSFVEALPKVIPVRYRQEGGRFIILPIE